MCQVTLNQDADMPTFGRILNAKSLLTKYWCAGEWNEFFSALYNGFNGLQFDATASEPITSYLVEGSFLANYEHVYDVIVAQVKINNSFDVRIWDVVLDFTLNKLDYHGVEVQDENNIKSISVYTALMLLHYWDTCDPLVPDYPTTVPEWLIENLDMSCDPKPRPEYVPRWAIQRMPRP